MEKILKMLKNMRKQDFEEQSTWKKISFNAVSEFNLFQ